MIESNMKETRNLTNTASLKTNLISVHLIEIRERIPNTKLSANTCR